MTDALFSAASTMRQVLDGADVAGIVELAENLKAGVDAMSAAMVCVKEKLCQGLEALESGNRELRVEREQLQEDKYVQRRSCQLAIVRQRVPFR